MNFSSFKYLYPPRPETKAPRESLRTFEQMGFIAQPKLNGSCAVLFLDGKCSKIMGRHNNSFTRETINSNHLNSLHRGYGYMVLVGEYLNKSQRDHRGKKLNGFVIFDILVFEGKHLKGTSFIDRQNLLDSLYVSKEQYDKFIDVISPFVFRANNFDTNFENLWKEIIQTEMYEGFVLKRKNGILEYNNRERNNTQWQIKIRKPTKNYSH